MQAAVQQAISSMHRRYFDPITLNDLASEVYISPFHFSRIFSKETGVTPGRYLTAVRLFEAKRLLLTTSLTVSDIVCSVGYSSVGTFSSRFTKAVGMTPTQYRDPEVAELLLAVAPHFHRLPSLNSLRATGQTCAQAPEPGTASLTGTIQLPLNAVPANVLVGVFADQIPQCGPVAHTALTHAGTSRLSVHNVPPGRWSVIAVAKHVGAGPADEVYIGTGREPVAAIAGRTCQVNLRLRPLKPTDPPIAITLASRRQVRDARNDLPQRSHLRAVA